MWNVKPDLQATQTIYFSLDTIEKVKGGSTDVAPYSEQIE
jgi:hypothetical protein